MEGRKYVPRAILVDLDPESINYVRSTQYGKLFDPENAVSGESGAGNNWSRGYYEQGAEIVDKVLSVIRREAEAADSLEGFQLIHSLGGGTGSGLGSLLISKLREEYSDKTLSTCSIIPSAKVSDTVVEPYNAILSMPHLMDNCDENFCIDNEAIFDICQYNLKLENRVTYGDLNHLASLALSGITTFQRFKGNLKTDIRKLNTAGSPRLHFFMTSFAPVYGKGIIDCQAFSISDLTQQVLDAKNIMTCNHNQGKFLSSAIIYRGQQTEKKDAEQIISVENEDPSEMIESLPKSTNTDVCDIPSRGLKTSATFIANSTAIQEPLKRISKQFAGLFRRKAFLHWYTMEESEFTDAENKVNDLISEFQQYEKVHSA